MDAEVLEGDGEQVPTLEVVQGLGVGPDRPGGADPLEVGVESLRVDAPSLARLVPSSACSPPPM
jgi:hypothetical protein